MTISFRSGQAAANGAAPSTLAVSKPAGVVDGDALLAFVCISANQTITTEPAGWTKLGEEATGTATGDCRHAAYSKIAASEPSSWTWGWSGAADCAAAVLAYTGVDSGHPVNTSTYRLMAGSTTSHVASSVTPSLNNSVAIFAYGTNPYFDGDTTFTTPTGLTARIEADPGAGTTNRAVLKVFDETVATPAATGTKTTNLNNSAKGVAWTVAVAPTGAVPLVITVESRAV
jgi:hypothetical protein